MTTGNVESWSGNMAEIGPLYPFVGAEFALFVVGVVLWILWHVRQARIETEQYEEEVQRFGSPESLNKILDAEDPYSP